MRVNVLLNSANLAVDVKNPGNLLLLIEINENAKIPEVRVLATSIQGFTTGFVVTALLNALQLPSLIHIRGVPSTLEIDGDHWTLVNFLDDNKQFNIEEINAQLTAAINPSPDATPVAGSGAAPAESTTSSQ